MPTSGDSLVSLGEVLLETEAREVYPDRVVDPEQESVGELLLDVAVAHQPRVPGRCVCGDKALCPARRSAEALGLLYVIMATNRLMNRYGCVSASAPIVGCR